MRGGTTTRRPCHNAACLLTGTTTSRLRPPPETSNGTQNITANCYPPHDTRDGTESGTRETGRETE